MKKINLLNGLENENNVSALLVNLIKEYPIIESKWKNFLNIDNIDSIETEIPLKRNKQEFGRIDIYIEDGSKEILIENKIWRYRELEPSQPLDYIEYLKNDKNNMLIFLIPKHYHHEDKLQDKNLSIKYWEDFILELKKDKFYKINIFIEQFIEFMENILSISYIHLSNKEKENINKEFIMENKTIPQIMKKLISIVDAVKEGGKIKVIHKEKPTEYNNSYGYELKLPENNDLFIWFGIDYDIWELEDYKSPIIIWLNNMSSEQGKLLKDKGFKYHKDEKENDTMIYSFNEDLYNKNISDIILQKLKEIERI